MNQRELDRLYDLIVKLCEWERCDPRIRDAAARVNDFVYAMGGGTWSGPETPKP